MKRLFLILVLFAGVSFAGDRNALGLWLSNYGWGFDYKRLNNNNTVLDIYLGGGLGFSDRGWSSIGLDGGYYFLSNAIKADASMGKFPVHYGPNIGFGYWTYGDKPNRGTHLVIAPNFAVGISWLPPTSFKWDLSFELFPGLRIDRQSDEHSNGSWGSTTSLSLGLDFRILVHAYLF